MNWSGKILKNIPLTLALLFGTVQIVFDLIGSVSPFPFMHYGMYSEIIYPPEKYGVYEIEVNGKKLDPMHFRVKVWENIFAPFHAYRRSTDTTDFGKHKLFLAKGLDFLHLEGLKENLQNTGCDQECFSGSYKNFLTNVLQVQVLHFTINQCFYSYENGEYKFMHKQVIFHD